MRTTLSRTFLLALGLGLAVSLFATACGSGSSASDADVAATSDQPSQAGVGDPAEPDQGEAADPDATPAASAAESSSDDTADDEVDEVDDRSDESPIAELFGIPISDDDAMEDQFAQLQVEAERRIGECMREQGFEYRPVDYSSLDGFDVSIDFESREFAEEYGFGIANSIDGAFGEAFENFVDPNQDYVESLSDGEREAYFLALTGQSFTIDNFDDSEGPENVFVEPSGCSGDAYEAAFEQFALFDQFGDQLDELTESFEADPRIVELNTTWADCMFDKGYGYTNYDDARADIERRYDAIVGDEMMRPGAPVDGSDEGEGDGDVTFFIGGGPAFSPEVQAKVDALGAEEREVAVATFDCELPLRSTYDEVRLEYEREWVEQYGDEVRAVVGS